MRRLSFKIKGTTALEMVLVLGIASLLFYIGLNFYQSFRMTEAAQDLQDKVEQLFFAAANYYQANCENGDLGPNPLPPLVPSNYNSSNGLSYPPSGSYSVDINNLLSNGYLTDWVPENSLVDASGGQSGYIVQLNPVTTGVNIAVNPCVVTAPGTSCSTITPPGNPISGDASVYNYGNNVSDVVTYGWNVQVSVKMANPNKMNLFLALLGADCMTGLVPGSSPAVTNTCTSMANPPMCATGDPPSFGPCPGYSSSDTTYLAWQRISSFATTKAQASIFSGLMPMLLPFKWQYTHDLKYEFEGGYQSVVDAYGNGQGSLTVPYYVCGSVAQRYLYVQAFYSNF